MKQIIFTRKTYKTGNSVCVTLPEELRNYLELQEGKELNMAAEKGKHGNYISLWCKKWPD